VLTPLKKSADQDEAAIGHDRKEDGGNMAHKGTQRARAYAVAVRVFTVAMGKGDGASNEQQQSQTQR
jgi:hypothetical protein